MGRAERENERLRIRQEHLIKAIGDAEALLSKIDHELVDLIETYKKKDWKPNENYLNWHADIAYELKRIKARKQAFKDDLMETVKATPLDEFG